MLNSVQKPHVNGLDLDALGEMVEAIEKDASPAQVGFEVTTRWAGQTRSETVVEGFSLGGKRVERAAHASSPTNRASCSAATARRTRRSC